jgi:hypothetical protein
VKVAAKELVRNGNRTIYIRAKDQPVWELAKRIAEIAGYEGISAYLLDLVREDIKDSGRITAIKARMNSEMDKLIQQVKNADL